MNKTISAHLDMELDTIEDQLPVNISYNLFYRLWMQFTSMVVTRMASIWWQPQLGDRII